MLTTFQIVNGFVDLDATEFFDLSTTTHTKGHLYKLFTRHTIYLLSMTRVTQKGISLYRVLPHKDYTQRKNYTYKYKTKEQLQKQNTNYKSN